MLSCSGVGKKDSPLEGRATSVVEKGTSERFITFAVSICGVLVGLGHLFPSFLVRALGACSKLHGQVLVVCVLGANY